MLAFPITAARAAKKGGPVILPTFPVSSVPLANMTVMGVHNVPSVRPFCVFVVESPVSLEAARSMLSSFGFFAVTCAIRSFQMVGVRMAKSRLRFLLSSDEALAG